MNNLYYDYLSFFILIYGKMKLYYANLRKMTKKTISIKGIK